MDGVLRIPVAEAPTADGRPATLRHFVAGRENELLPVGVDAVLNGEASLGPIVLHGPSGVGKTHLAGGLALRYAQSTPTAIVHLLPASDIVHGYPGLAKDEEWCSGEAYREADLLIVEDLDELRKKPAAQQELAGLLDAVCEHGGIVLVTTRMAPIQFRELIGPLRSRLAAGLLIPLALPESPTREALIRELSAALGIELTDEALGVMAAELHGSVPQLRGALHTLGYADPAARRKVDAEAVWSLVSGGRGARPTIRTVATRTATHFGLKLTDLKSRSRSRNVAGARAVAMFLARRFTGKSYGQIGEYFDRDHTTVMYNCQRTEELVECDPTTRDAVSTLEVSLGNRNPKRQRGLAAKPR